MSRSFLIPYPQSSVYDRVSVTLRNSEVAAVTEAGWLRLAGAGDPAAQLEVRDAALDVQAILRTDKTNGAALLSVQNDARSFQVGVGADDAFRVYDATASTSPFLIEPGAPTNSLYTDSSGQFGVGNAPSTLGHFYDAIGNPDVMVETGSATGQAGIRFKNSAQQWRWHVFTDGKCHLRDVTGSTNPVQIEPAAPTASLYVDSAGQLGLQTSAPASRLDVGAGALTLSEMTAPGAPAANGVAIYAEDNGAGKTRLMARFNTGAAQQIAIQP